jgi:hypothetical protein
MLTNPDDNRPARRARSEATDGRGVCDVGRDADTVACRRRAVRVALMPLRLLLGVALRMLVTSAVFIICAAVALRLLGYDLPGASDLDKYFEGLEQLSDVLS